MADVNVRRVEELDEEGAVLWHASVIDGDASEVVEVHVDPALDSDDEIEIERVVADRVQRERDELPPGRDGLRELRERGPIRIGSDELERWRGMRES
jgi:hypothetical protein